jgi:ABC-type glycerol-3-phosphate transport system permease component
MTCPACHTTLTQDAHFCPHCGAAVPTPPYQPQAPVYGVPTYGVPIASYPSRVARHLQVVGILWAVYAIEHTLSKIAGLMFLHGIFGDRFNNNWPFIWTPFGNPGFSMLWPVITASIVVTLVLSILTAYALLTRQSWGRILAIITAILSLFHPIFGTALGIYTLWVLAPVASGAEYEAIANTAHPR